MHLFVHGLNGAAFHKNNGLYVGNTNNDICPRDTFVIKMTVKLNLGCGPTPFDGWINLDKSWNTYLYKFPLLKKLVLKLLLSLGWVTEDALVHVVDYSPDLDIRRCDVTKGIAFDEMSVDYIYTSHMLEHLRKEDTMFVLKECYRVLKQGGVLRVVVPDLKLYAEEYINNGESSADSDAFDADKFMDNIMLQGIGEVRPLFYRLMCKRHQWMYDFESLAKRLHDCGFGKVKKCKLGEGSLPDLPYLEQEESHSRSVYLEAIK
jgi:predicted SAM-dependent methyltransferase